jgi:hypothetical protein
MTSRAKRSPLLLQFGERIEMPRGPEVRADPARQVMQVRIGDIWIDAIDASNVALCTSTDRTDVKHESTDEE